jgi:hypothetical protein
MIRSCLFVLLVGVFGVSCRQESKSSPAALTAQDTALHREWKAANFRMIDTAISQLRAGDIVLRLGADVTSEMLRGMNQKKQDFSHCGIVDMEDGQPVVYHSIGGEDNPDAHMRRDAAPQFFHPLSNAGGGIYRIALLPAEQDTLLATVRGWYKEGRGFDMDFDLATDTQLYCAEMVYKAFGKACRQKPPFTQSVLGGFRYVAVDDLYTSGAGHLVWRFRFQ